VVYGSDEMAAPLRRSLPSLGRALLKPAPVRMLSAEASDALVEVKPGEIGMVSGIPEEQLRRKVTPSTHSLSCFRVDRCGHIERCSGFKAGERWDGIHVLAVVGGSRG
jgi:hypothetical protein